MKDDDLVRRLRRMRRTVDMLQSDLRDGRVNDLLLAATEAHMENGIATEPRCGGLVPLVDELRESTLTPRPELYRDTIRASERLKDAIEGIVSLIG
jgi:hypothetical protein